MFKAANGEHLRTLGKFHLKFKIGEREVHHEFYKVRDLGGEDIILGINFIHRYHLNYDTETRGFFWKGNFGWNTGILKVNKGQTIKEYTQQFVQCEIRTDSGCLVKAGVPCMVNVVSEECPLLVGGPAMVVPDENGLVYVPVLNASFEPLELHRNEPIGRAENLDGCQTKEVSEEYVSSVRRDVEADLKKTGEQLTPEKRKFILENTNLSSIPERYRQQYMDVILKHHAAISRDSNDLGRTEALLHDIELRDREPAYVQQFKIPDVQRDELHKSVAEWLKLGVVQPCRSKYNSPLFCVAKKNGGLRIVQDFRALNAKTLEDKYSMKDIAECINEIGQSGSSLFTTIDLTAGFWQMLLEPKSRPYTAFTVPGKGQFQWVTTPMGLLGAPASFQRLMEKVVQGIQNVLVYIDDLLLHSGQHPEHLKLLDDVLFRLVHNGIKMNLKKCIFGSPEVTYLGFQLTPEGIKPGKDKLKAVADFNPPTNTREVRQFLGLCNFFRAHIKDFSKIASPLTELTRKECPWKAGPLPAKAHQAFKQLQEALVSEPVVAYPRRGLQYALTTDACTGTDEHPGGIGAILTQIDKDGNHHALGYASRKLTDYEKNYTPFLLEMTGCLWGIDHFKYYLKGRPFFLFTDHQPLVGLGKVHKKTYNRLTEAMNEYNFQMIYKKGEEMPADYLSRNVVSSIVWSDAELLNEQEADEVLSKVRRYVVSQELPDDRGLRDLIRRQAEGCFLEDDILWKRISHKEQPVVMLPRRLIQTVLQRAHGDNLSGHNGIFQTKQRLLQSYYWSGMDTDIQDFISKCHKCQVGRKRSGPPQLLSPLPQCTEPQQRVHADLFGPLKTTIGDKKYILSMTDAFTKYVELVVIPSKDAATVAKAIYDRWICRFGCPLQVVTDQGKEFCAQLTDELFTLLNIQHTTTTAYHPQCNSQAEVANKTIAKYLSRVVGEDTLDWEDYIGPLMFSYNTSFHRSIKNTPFFLTHGMEARQPGFNAADVRTKFEGPGSPEEMLGRLQRARRLAQEENEQSTLIAQQQHDKKAEPHGYVRDQLVLLEDNYFASRNAKLAPKFTGPHRILELKGECNVVLKMAQSGRKVTVHVDRIKPYHAPIQKESESDSDQLIPDPVPAPTVPPKQSVAVPPPVPQRFSDPVAHRTRSKNPNISALIRHTPQDNEFAGEGVQKCQPILISENEQEEQWVLVIKKPKRRVRKPAWLKKREINWAANERATGDPLIEPLPDDWIEFEWIESVPVQPPVQQQPPVIHPDQPIPQDFHDDDDDDQPPPDSPSPPRTHDSRDDSWRASQSDTPESDSSTHDPSFREPSSPSETDADLSLYQDFSSGASTPTTPPSGIVPNRSALSPEFLPPNKTLILKPPVKLAEQSPPLPPRKPTTACAYPDPPRKPGPSPGPPPTQGITPSPFGDYVYYEVPADFGADFRQKCPPLPPTPKSPLFKAPKLGNLFSRVSSTRETRSTTKLPNSVLHQYPSERKQKQ
jgi:transposase InsO family protein